MKILSRAVGALETNCYLLVDETAGAAAVVDPGDEADALIAWIAENGADVRYILLTHGHYDHTGAVPALHERFPAAEVCIHAADADGAGSRLFPLGAQLRELKHYGEGDRLALGALTVEVLHTPGHSEGSVTLRVPGALFTGDTLFAGSCGRVDLRGGDERKMLASLARLGAMEGEYAVYPGHGEASTLTAEKRYNPYIAMALQRGAR